jgi:ribosomal protein S18 acetylase RimI-like enzyme
MTGDDNPHALTLRSAVPADHEFLYELYGDTRRSEMADWGWDLTQQQNFLKLQFTAQTRHYDLAFPNADHQIVLCDDRAVGRILVYRSEHAIRLVNIALLPEHRGRGIGASLIRGLFEEATQAGKPVTLHVGKLSRAARLYQRLGFSITGDTGTDYKMEWRPGESSSDGRQDI